MGIGSAHGFKHQRGSWNVFAADEEGLLYFYVQDTECLTNCLHVECTSPEEGGGGSSARSSGKTGLSLILLLFPSWSDDWCYVQFQASHNYTQWLKAKQGCHKGTLLPWQVGRYCGLKEGGNGF